MTERITVNVKELSREEIDDIIDEKTEVYNRSEYIRKLIEEDMHSEIIE